MYKTSLDTVITHRMWGSEEFQQKLYNFYRLYSFKYVCTKFINNFSAFRVSYVTKLFAKLGKFF